MQKSSQIREPPAEVVKECIAQPSKVSLSDDHHVEVSVLKSSVTI